MPAIDGNKIKRTILEVIQTIDNSNKSKYGAQHALQTGGVLHQTAQILSKDGSVDEQALLTVFGDLFRVGHLAWGLNLMNPNPPNFHITEQGRKLLKNLSRDPFNPDGYLATLIMTSLSEATMSYLNEGLDAFNAGYFKSAAVMIGGATENIILDLRTAILTKSTLLNKQHLKKLGSEQIRVILSGIKNTLDTLTPQMSIRLSEKYQSYWPSFTQQIRRTRNDAGHPENLQHFTFEDAHSALLIFPELAKLSKELNEWIATL